jgi:hypothetical protein
MRNSDCRTHIAAVDSSRTVVRKEAAVPMLAAGSDIDKEAADIEVEEEVGEVFVAQTKLKLYHRLGRTAAHIVRLPYN